jgi:hypothetical protein
VSVSDNPARIVRFWQAVEIFSPQQLPKPAARNHTTDLRPGEPMPWEPGSRLTAPKPGNVWRHEVFGGVYPLSRVRDALVAGYGQDDPEAAPTRGDSALFACRIDGDGFLAEDSTVVSACAWGIGQVSQGKSPLGGFEQDTFRHAEALSRLPDARAGLKLLAQSIRAAVPDSVSAGVKVATAGALAALGGPLAAAGGAMAGSLAGNAVKSAMGGTSAVTTTTSQATGGAPPQAPARIDVDAITGADLHRFSTELAARLGVGDTLRPAGIRVRSYQIRQDRGDEDTGQPFLNSFLADDVARVGTALTSGDVGTAVTRYLAATQKLNTARRIDVQREPSRVLAGFAPEYIPPARWVTNTDRPLAFSQQFAVNQIMDTLTDSPGVFAVNGPPGTGKTTMLRDVVAAIVVRRAIELACLDSPAEAFTGARHEWLADRFTHRISRLAPKLAGYEIVVASSNNAAVENVTTEIPGPKGIGAQWREAAAAVDYFTATASRVIGDGAWAMIAAPLGNFTKRSAFVRDFWFGGRERAGAGMLDVLQSPGAVPDWRNAVASFRRALARVTTLSSERSEVSRHISGLPLAIAERDRAAAAIQAAMTQRARLEERQRVLDAEHGQASDRWHAAEITVRTHLLGRPGRLSVLFARGRHSRREWHAAHQELLARFARADAGRDAVSRTAAVLSQQVRDRTREEETARSLYVRWDSQAAESQRAVDDARRRWGDHVPAGPEYAETRRRDLIERRELSSPWTDEEFSRARTELFLAALALHKALILAEAPRIRANLSALMDIHAGKGRPDAAATLAAWQTLFLVVPVVSSTFASFGRLFAGLGREALGWLLVDEAGQAAPQNAVGALWRSRRAVIVGDPLQLEPVVTLPWGGQVALLREFGVAEEWAPGRTSVQQVADRLAVHGTSLPGATGEPVWVGTPLRVHRRCDRPMFELSNRIAYSGLMVFGTPERKAFHGKDAWYDIRSTASTGHWIEAEGEALRETLEGLRDGGVRAEEIRVLSPFRAVAAEAAKVHEKVFPVVTRDDRATWVGTVHTMQGKEADAVILILGGDPERPGARRFATQAPNLLNVAVSRAKRRLYVIGNRQTWGTERYFSELADPALLRPYRPH